MEYCNDRCTSKIRVTDKNNEAKEMDRLIQITEFFRLCLQGLKHAKFLTAGKNSHSIQTRKILLLILIQ